MARKKKGSGKLGSGEYADFVPVVFARSEEEAQEYQELLGDHDILATLATVEDVKEGDADSALRKGQMSRGVPVLVPEVLLDEASEIIADREDTDEFVVDDDDDDDNDEDLEYAEGFDGTLGDPIDDDDDDDEDDDQ